MEPQDFIEVEHFEGRHNPSDIFTKEDCKLSTKNKIEKIPLIGFSESVQSESGSKENSCGIIDDKRKHFLFKGFLGKIHSCTFMEVTYSGSSWEITTTSLSMSYWRSLINREVRRVTHFFFSKLNFYFVFVEKILSL